MNIFFEKLLEGEVNLFIENEKIIKIVSFNKVLNNTIEDLYKMTEKLDLQLDINHPTIKLLFFHNLTLSIVHYLKECKEDKIIFFTSKNVYNKSINSIIRKLKNIFGIVLWEENKSFDEFCEDLMKFDCKLISKLETLSNKESKVKSFKRIKKELQKNGLSYLEKIFFQNLQNKYILMK